MDAERSDFAAQGVSRNRNRRRWCYQENCSESYGRLAFPTCIFAGRISSSLFFHSPLGAWQYAGLHPPFRSLLSREMQVPLGIQCKTRLCPRLVNCAISRAELVRPTSKTRAASDFASERTSSHLHNHMHVLNHFTRTEQPGAIPPYNISQKTY